jgi:hypothetical protein
MPGSLFQAVPVDVGIRSFGLCEPFFPGRSIVLRMTKSRWVDKSPSRLPHKDRWSIDAAGIAPSTPFLQLERRIGPLDSRRGHELELGGSPPIPFLEACGLPAQFPASAWANLIFTANAVCFLFVILALRRWKQPMERSGDWSEQPSLSVGTVIRFVRSKPRLQVILARNFEFSFFISAIPAVAPIIGLKVLHFNSSELGLLFASMGAGSVIAALFIPPWVRKLFAGNVLTLSNSVIALIDLLMAFIHEPSFFFLAAALVGAGWTVSASELWVAGQQAIPDWARGRLTAAIITISQGATVLGGVIWSGLVAIGGANTALLEAGVLFSVTILLTTGYGRVKRILGAFAEIRAVVPQRISQADQATAIPA